MLSCLTILPGGFVCAIDCLSEDRCATPDHALSPSVAPFILLTSTFFVFGETAVLVFQAATARA
jgi:hypothetical protein